MDPVQPTAGRTGPVSRIVRASTTEVTTLVWAAQYVIPLQQVIHGMVGLTASKVPPLRLAAQVP